MCCRWRVSSRGRERNARWGGQQKRIKDEDRWTVGRVGRGSNKRRCARASDASLLSRYFYDVAAFRGSLGKKGSLFVGRIPLRNTQSWVILYRASTDNTSFVGY